MSKDGVDPLYPVSAEKIGVNFAHKYGIEGTDAAALAKLCALSVAEIVDGGQESDGPGGPLTYSGPDSRRPAGCRNGRERIQGRAGRHGFRSSSDLIVPKCRQAWSMPGFAKKRYCAQFARRGKRNESRPTILTAPPISPTMLAMVNTDRYSRSRPGSPQGPLSPRAHPPTSIVSPTSPLRCRGGCGMVQRTGLKSLTCSTTLEGEMELRTDPKTRKLPKYDEHLLGELRQDRRSQWSGPAKMATLRSPQRQDPRVPARRFAGRRTGSRKSAAGCDREGRQGGHATLNSDYTKFTVITNSRHHTLLLTFSKSVYSLSLIF